MVERNFQLKVLSLRMVMNSSALSRESAPAYAMNFSIQYIIVQN